jgi:hypothetical protein
VHLLRFVNLILVQFIPFVNPLPGAHGGLVVAIGAGAGMLRGNGGMAGDLQARDQTSDRGDGFLAGSQFWRSQRRVVANFCCEQC